MGTTKVAAVAAALLAGGLIATALVAGVLPADERPERSTDAAGNHDLQSGYAVRGQAWATELFGRRYGRYLLAAADRGRGPGARHA